MGKVFDLVDGLGSELGVISIIAIAVITLYFAGKLGWLRFPGQKKRERTLIRYNPHPPGQAKECRDHAEALVRIETTLKLQSKETNRRLAAIERKVNNGRT